jgi:hypothetical protein
MVNCPKCGTGVREEKAFCHNCGAPMDAAMRRREAEPQPDFGATIIEPPRRAAPQPFVPPVVTEVQPAARETAPVAAHQPAAQQPAAHAAFPSPPGAQPIGKQRSSRKIGFGFVLLLLFLMFVVFVIALWLD